MLASGCCMGVLSLSLTNPPFLCKSASGLMERGQYSILLGQAVSRSGRQKKSRHYSQHSSLDATHP